MNVTEEWIKDGFAAAARIRALGYSGRADQLLGWIERQAITDDERRLLRAGRRSRRPPPRPSTAGRIRGLLERDPDLELWQVRERLGLSSTEGGKAYARARREILGAAAQATEDGPPASEARAAPSTSDQIRRLLLREPSLQLWQVRERLGLASTQGGNAYASARRELQGQSGEALA